jgi:uncharacterized protein (TIGR02147 family)
MDSLKLDISKIAKRIDILTFLSGVDFLRKLFDESKKSTPKMTYREFSELLGFGSTNYLHLLCTGKRSLGPKAAERISQALSFGEKHTRFFVLLAKYESSRNPAEREVYFEEIVELKGKQLSTPLSKVQLEYFSEWYHAVLREMVLLPDFSPDPQWISQRIVPRITADNAKRSWEVLTSLGYVEYSSDLNRWVQSEVRINIPAGAKNLSIIRFHQKMAELGKESITRIPAVSRDISALTIPMDPVLFDHLKNAISTLKQEALEKAESIPNPAEIYQFNIQLFAVSLKEKQK